MQNIRCRLCRASILARSCLLAALLGIIASMPFANAAETVSCDFGTQPGLWVEQQELETTSGSVAELLTENLPVWQVLDSQCQLEPLLNQRVQAAGGSKDRSEGAQRHIGVLLFGDSIDYRIARSFCNAALGHGLEHMSDDGIAIHH
ncbi:hypothetical protein COCSUDRAFT_54167, partial [Coccomyxa subellipsoidea C-169]